MVCSRLLAARFGQACPRCRPALSNADRRVVGRPLPDGSPTLDEACATRVVLKPHVPRAAS
eukprot:674721-Alexandrium_andersonii.AAC.1